MTVQGLPAVLAAMHQVPVALERELVAELDVSAQHLVLNMRARARKYRTLLALGVRPEAPDKFMREIGPTADYAVPQEEGIRPGGRGLPRYSDPAAADIVGWLSSKAFAGRAEPRRNSMAAVRADLELRDRYQGLAWHIRHKGVKPGPFVLPAFQELERPLRRRLEAAAERGLAGAGGAA